MSTSQGGGTGRPEGPPYMPNTWPMGGRLETGVDIPASAVFLALFLAGAVTHMTILQVNKRRGHKFLFSGLLFAFCMARTATCVLRIASACIPKNIRLAMAAQILVSAGVLLVYIINLIFAQRIIRAQHPNWGWHRAFAIFVRANFVLIILTLAMVITATVQSFYTLSTNTRRIDRDIQLYAGTYFTFVSFLPIPIILLGLAIPRKGPADKFGTGRFRTKITILLTASFLVCLGAAYKCGTSYLSPVPRSRPLPDYFSKAAFYTVNFTVEIIVVYLYAFLRIDLRFHIPNGAKGAGSYNPTDAMRPRPRPESGDSRLSRRVGRVSGVPVSHEDLSRLYNEQDAYALEEEAEGDLELAGVATREKDEKAGSVGRGASWNRLPDPDYSEWPGDVEMGLQRGRDSSSSSELRRAVSEDRSRRSPRRVRRGSSHEHRREVVHVSEARRSQRVEKIERADRCDDDEDLVILSLVVAFSYLWSYICVPTSLTYCTEPRQRLGRPQRRISTRARYSRQPAAAALRHPRSMDVLDRSRQVRYIRAV